MQFLRPTIRGRRRSEGGVHQILTTLGVLDTCGSGKGAGVVAGIGATIKSYGALCNSATGAGV